MPAHSTAHGDDLSVIDYDVLLSPLLLKSEYPLTERAKATIQVARNAAADVLIGDDDRVVVVVGPCSIHDAEQGLAVRLQIGSCRKPFDMK